MAIAAGEAEGGGGGGAAGVKVVDAPETVVEGTDMGTLPQAPTPRYFTPLVPFYAPLYASRPVVTYL